MTNKLILINTDTHAVVPKKLEPITYYYTASPLREKLIEYLDKSARHESFLYDDMWDNLIKIAPQLTTPPVLRWEKPHAMGSALYAGNYAIATVHKGIGKWALYTRVHGEPISQQCDTEAEARRAAEKALGLPEIEEV